MTTINVQRPTATVQPSTPATNSGTGTPTTSSTNGQALNREVADNGVYPAGQGRRSSTSVAPPRRAGSLGAPRTQTPPSTPVAVSEQAVAQRRALLCLVPPYILENIRRNGTPEQSAAAEKALAFHQENTQTREGVMAARRKPPKTPTPPSDPHQVHRAIYTASNTENLPGRLLRKEGQAPSQDVAVNEAYDGLGETFNFYDQVLNRNSIDNAGLELDATVHFGDKYDNAYWNSQQMVFGDGDGQIFNRFTAALDVIGHELTHGVTEHDAHLAYEGQSGALNESVSDVFGSLIKQRALGQTADQADWLIGSGLLAKGINGVALRSMKDPGTAYDDPLLGKDPQPKTMDGYVQTEDDNGGVHTNSGIPNYAFYKAASAMGGNAWDKPAKIWYAALRDKSLSPNSDFQGFASATLAAAERLYGADSAERGAVRDGWAAAGVEVA